MDLSKWRIVGLSDPREPGRERWVGLSHVSRLGLGWPVVWRHRDQLRLRSRAAGWFRELAGAGQAPVETVILGAVVALDEWGAIHLCRGVIEAFRERGEADCNVLGDGGGLARPVAHISEEGEIVYYPSEEEASSQCGNTSEGLCVALWQGRGWFDC